MSKTTSQHMNRYNLYILFTMKSVSYILKIGEKHLSMYKLSFISALLLKCVILGKLLNISETQCLYV